MISFDFYLKINHQIYFKITTSNIKINIEN